MARLTKIILTFLIVIFSFQAQAKNPPPGTGTSDIPANILIMLDNSGSMAWDINGNTITSWKTMITTVFDVAVDMRKNSKTYGKSFKIILSEKNCKSVYIPPGFAHGFQTLKNENIVVYNCTELRSINNEYGIKFNDPKLKIKWPLSKPIITKKDNNAPNLSEIKK